MFNKLRRVGLYSLLVFGFCVAISNCLPDKTTLYAANKQVVDTDDVAAAQRFEKVFEQVVEQVKPAVVSITSVKVFKHTHSGTSGISSAMIFLTNFSNRGLLRANIRCRDLVRV